MSEYSINGIQQVGVGTENFRKSWDWFIRHLGFDVKILEDDTVAERMLPYTGCKPQKRHACIAVNLNGGGGLEIWQYSERKPKPAAQPAGAGDLGIFAAKVRCRDVSALHARLTAGTATTSPAASTTAGAATTTPVTRTPDGTPCFYLKDLYGNIFQIIQDSNVFIPQSTPAGGICGAMVGVSDMDRSIDFYRSILGYDKILYDVTGPQPDWTCTQQARQNPQHQVIPGAEGSFRRVLLANSKTPSSAFSGLYGANTIELVQALDRKPVKIYEGRYWGDPGFIQICYDVTGMDALGRFCASKGCPFTVDSCPDGQIFDMGDASGRFTYIEDPDGTLIEFVETYKVPVAKKFGWFIDLTKRDPRKPLPKFLFRAMGLISRQKA